MRHTPSRALLAAGLAAAALTGCSSLQSSDGFLSRITPHRIEVVQGNVVTREQVQAVRTGMSRAQVRDILGSPLLTSAFHADRWDYVFTIRRQGAEPQLRRVLATFDGERLVSLDTGGELPSEREFVASIDNRKTPRKLPPLALTDEQIAALPKGRGAAPSSLSSASPPSSGTTAANGAGPAEPPARSYPPLEPVR